MVFLLSKCDIVLLNLPFPAREDETGGLGLPVPSEKNYDKFDY